MVIFKQFALFLMLGSVICAPADAMGGRKNKKEVTQSEVKSSDSKAAESTNTASDSTPEKAVLPALEHSQDVTKDNASTVHPVIAPVLPSTLPAHTMESPQCPCIGWSQVALLTLPSVVEISATQQPEPKAASGGMGGLMVPKGPHGSLFEDLFRDFLDMERAPRKVQAIGSGFIIKSDDKHGYVVTNAHVVSDAKNIKITLHDKTEIEGTVVCTDERSDIALLKFSLDTLPKEKRTITALEWGDSDQLKVAEPVMAIGNPFGFGNTVTTGVVSYKGRYLPNGAQQDFEFLQHSAQINMGSSGGCLLGSNGKVVGINTAIITPNSGNVGIGFSIPSNDAKRIIEQLISHGYIKRGYLGVRIQQISDELRASMGLSKEDGILVVGSISDDGPAKGILEVGDVILEFNGKKIKDAYQLPHIVSNSEIGKAVTIKILRQKSGDSKYTPFVVSIKVGELPLNKETDGGATALEAAKKTSETLEILGLTITAISKDIKKELEKEKKNVHGVIVSKVDYRQTNPEFPILLRKGDIIETAHGKPIHSLKDFEEAVDLAKRDRDYILLYVWRRGEDPRFLPFYLKGSTQSTPKDEKAKSSEKKS